MAGEQPVVVGIDEFGKRCLRLDQSRARPRTSDRPAQRLAAAVPGGRAKPR